MISYWDQCFMQASNEGMILVVDPEDFESFPEEILQAATRVGYSHVTSDMPDEVYFARLH